MTRPRIVSLCSGVGMLDEAVAASFDGDVIIHAETDPHACTILDHHYPTIPNLGDWTTLTTLDGLRPDIICGGLPCQPVSGAGRGAGDDDERYLYDELVRILTNSTLRPTLVLENVRGFLYPRHGRLFWRLIRSLADLGYLGRYEIVRASDAGAPHRRERWVCVAGHPDSQPTGRHPRSIPRTEEERRPHGGIGDGSGDAAPIASHSDSDRFDGIPQRNGMEIPDSQGRGSRDDTERRELDAGRESGPDPTPAHPFGPRPQGHGGSDGFRAGGYVEAAESVGALVGSNTDRPVNDGNPSSDDPSPRH